jgi:glycosyltransferase involved in cell wall biosynthesis
MQKVMMVGTSPHASGGISAVVRGYFESGVADRLGITYVATHTTGTVIRKLHCYLAGLVRALLSMHRYRIVHVQTASWWSFRRLYPVILLARARSKKIIIHLHGGQFDKYYRTASSLEQRMIRHGFAAADRVVVLSNDWHERLASLCGQEKLMVIPNGVPVDVTGGDPEEKRGRIPRRLLFLGDIIPRKGVYDLIDALAAVAGCLPDAELHICGRGEIDRARRRAAERGVAGLIHFPCWVGGKEKEALLRNAHAFVLPSHAECLPMSILEAMARSVPVIATRVGAIPGVITDGLDGFLIEPGDQEALAVSLLRLLTNDDQWERMARAARETAVARFSLSGSLEKLRELYADLGAGEDAECLRSVHPPPVEPSRGRF